MPLASSTTFDSFFIILSLDGSRQVQSQMHDDAQATVSSILDHYVLRPTFL